MATFSAIFAPAKNTADKTVLVPATSSASIIIGSSASATIFLITVDSDTNIRFGASTNIANATADDFPMYAGSYMTFQLPVGADRIRLYSTGGGNAWVWQLGRS